MRIILIAVLLVVTGCGGIAIGTRIDMVGAKYKKVAHEIELGDSKESVLAVLIPIQKGLPLRVLKPADHYYRGNKKVDIFYMRTQRQPDNFTTDDEFTPYVFHNDRLVGIGWYFLGGVKTISKGTSSPY